MPVRERRIECYEVLPGLVRTTFVYIFAYFLLADLVVDQLGSRWRVVVVGENSEALRTLRCRSTDERDEELPTLMARWDATTAVAFRASRRLSLQRRSKQPETLVP